MYNSGIALPMEKARKKRKGEAYHQGAGVQTLSSCERVRTKKNWKLHAGRWAMECPRWNARKKNTRLSTAAMLRCSVPDDCKKKEKGLRLCKSVRERLKSKKWSGVAFAFAALSTSSIAATTPYGQSMGKKGNWLVCDRILSIPSRRRPYRHGS